MDQKTKKIRERERTKSRTVPLSGWNVPSDIQNIHNVSKIRRKVKGDKYPESKGLLNISTVKMTNSQYPISNKQGAAPYVHREYN